MKSFYSNDTARCRARLQLAGMTLVEVMIASTIMVMVIFAMLTANYIGLRENQLMASKSGANNTSRNVANYLYQDIRMAKGYQIGSLSGTNALIPITNGFQQGVALQLFPILISTNESIDTSKYILYYFDLKDATNSNGRLWRYVSTNQTTMVLASNLINTLYFTGEDFTGATQAVRTYKGIIHTTLQFSEFQYPKTKVGSNYLFNYYRIDCRATPHLPDGP
jgi:hypothetical protein